MDRTNARDQISEVEGAYHDASRPTVPVPLALVSALCVAGGVVLLGLAVDGWQFAVSRVLGALLLGAAAAVPVLRRRRAGLHGTRGSARQENLVLALVAVVLAITGADADRDLALVFVGIGVVAGLAWLLLLRGVLSAGGRR